jgi:hypothetical protein
MSQLIPTIAEESHIRAFQGLPHYDTVIPFGDSLKFAALSLPGRLDVEQLEHEVRTHRDPVLREQALYQLLAQQGSAALPIVEEILFEDRDADLRINLMWALQGLGDERGKELIVDLITDRDARVQEWARLLSWEKGWSSEDFRRAREATFYPGRTFDETIFLHIHCHLYIRLDASNNLWGHVLLSPQMLARVYGQALACPITATRERELVISKTLSGLHDDGTDHYETFLFRGFTERTSPLTGNFYFESNGPRPFYLSGKADDTSEGMVENVPIPFAREGQWFLNEHLPLQGNYAIEYVRGRFQGWAYVNLERIQQSGGEFLFPGNSVLSTLHHPIVGPKTNTFIVGAFKGKVVDWNGDGILDLNYLPSHATAQGEVDSDLDGSPDIPGRTVCARPLH